jgi:hypothetical protein
MTGASTGRWREVLVGWNPKDNFKGDLRSIRIYGRNLVPSEFL